MSEIRPDYYKMVVNGTEADGFDIMQAVMTEEEYRGFLKGNILKYALRSDKKDPTKEGSIRDLRKIVTYANRLIEKDMEGSIEQENDRRATGSRGEKHPSTGEEVGFKLLWNEKESQG